ncbi:MAG: FAD-dependent monooxygenase [Halofilum sp. (in: g-proteobacteria)]|nr:FAD-dependent monooxygenase [Halofilum sp. (in: g-proteobacteria)]
MVGAGAVGATLALALAQRGRRVAAGRRPPRPGAGAGRGLRRVRGVAQLRERGPAHAPRRLAGDRGRAREPVRRHGPVGRRRPRRDALRQRRDRRAGAGLLRRGGAGRGRAARGAGRARPRRAALGHARRVAGAARRPRAGGHRRRRDARGGARRRRRRRALAPAPARRHRGAALRLRPARHRVQLRHRGAPRRGRAPALPARRAGGDAAARRRALLAGLVPSRDEAERLVALDEAAFCAELSEATGHALGAVTGATRRRAFPIVRRHAERYTGARVALVGDAAHTIHPQAGQGLNIGLLDAAALAEVVGATGDAGARRGLRRYARWRRGHNTAVMAAMDFFHHGFAHGGPARAGLRNAGMLVADRSGPAKRLFTRLGAGLAGDLPSLARPLRAGSGGTPGDDPL